MKIPATIITGFLGSGKTTLIRHLLESANGRRLALIINEFGDLGIDREVLLGCGIEGCADDDIVELANGCICCTVADAFLPTMERLLRQSPPPDHIVIETSGLALPKPLVQAFNWPEIRARVTVDGVITVVDGPAVAEGRFAHDPAAVQANRENDPALDHEAPLKEVFEDQLFCADMVVVNKTDLIGGNLLDSLNSELRASLRPATGLVTAVQGAVDSRVILGLAAGAENDLDARPSHHEGEVDHDHDDFETFVARLGPVADLVALETRIRSVATSHDLLRIKGFVNVPGKDRRHVIQAVGPRIARYYDRPWRSGEERKSELVVIAEKGIDRKAVLDALTTEPAFS